jgi:hypothetical protein
VIRLLEQFLKAWVAAKRVKQRMKPQFVDETTGRSSERVLDIGQRLIRSHCPAFSVAPVSESERPLGFHWGTLLRFFRRERGNNLFKTRIAAERIPDRMQF